MSVDESTNVENNQPEQAETSTEPEQKPTPNEVKPEPKQDEFVPPKSQAELDELIKKRVERAKEKAAEEVRAEYVNFVPASKVEELTEKLTAEQQAARNALKQSAVLKAGLDASMANRLQGDTVEEWEADAQSLAELFKKRSPVHTPTEVRGFGGGAPGDVPLDPSELAKQIKRL